MESRFLAESHRLSITGLALQLGITAAVLSASQSPIIETTEETLESADVGAIANGCRRARFCNAFTWKPT